MLLKKGSTGDDVRQLQTRLGLTADGIFGSGTEASVKTWQAQNNLSVDGMVGNDTWAKLFPEESPTDISSTESLQVLKGHIPDTVIAQIQPIEALNTPLRLAHFLAQCSHESAGFTLVYENLNYSAAGLKATFPKYFPAPLNQTYARDQPKIGARIYANRMGNGDEASGDGYTYRGRGYIQLTGKANYTSFGAFIGEDTVANPDLVATKFPLASAGFFFDTNKIWTVCDTGATDAAITAVTKKVNGGTNGLADRTKLFKQYYALLHS
ncbi:MAG: peptidoglycan-binding protein [Methylobacter sp.]|nr:peptidoglycan-binding protein [Methylobacter sp.]